MPEKGEEAETVNLQRLGDNKDGGGRNSNRRRQATTRNKRVIIFGVLVTICIIILIIVGAWFIYTTASDSHPEWLQTIPGLHYRPSSSVRASLIMFRSTDELSYQPWVEAIDDFLEDYTNITTGNIRICNYDKLPSPDTVCQVDIRAFHHCSKENHYGYNKASPCIFLKIHKFPDWVPEYYNISDLPDTIPQELKHYILQTRPAHLQTLWVNCEGQTPADQEFIGPITYFPQRGFPGYFFPYRNIEGYLSPLVAVHLERPQLGVVINIECKLWAKNIVHDHEKQIGLVRFELMID